MHALRRYKLQLLIQQRFNNDRGAFILESGLSKGRVSQLLDPKEAFGDNAAANLEKRLKLDPGYFDTLDARTLQFALAFEDLPEHQKASWEDLVAMLTGKKKPNPP
jgi:hypothetical protein